MYVIFFLYINSDFESCKTISEKEGPEVRHYIEITMHVSGTSAAAVYQDPIKKPRVRCDSAELAKQVRDQLHYAKRLYIERLHTMITNDNITNREDWFVLLLLFWRPKLSRFSFIYCLLHFCTRVCIVFLFQVGFGSNTVLQEKITSTFLGKFSSVWFSLFAYKKNSISSLKVNSCIFLLFIKMLIIMTT